MNPPPENGSGQFLATDQGKTESNTIEIPSIALPKGGGAIKGIDEKLNVNAVNGTASFSVPLPFSPSSPITCLQFGGGQWFFWFGLEPGLALYQAQNQPRFALQSADHLMHDIKRMETSYLNKNKREYELTKHVSLAMLDPLALQKPRATGVCDFAIPEALYDMSHAGQYFRRINSVSVKLSLVSNKYRKDKAVSDGYAEDLGNDTRFAYNIGAIQSIATSHAQNDSGMFELNFNDERYLAFRIARSRKTI